jgi:ABC-type multidrug transport system, ATPase and permease components
MRYVYILSAAILIIVMFINSLADYMKEKSIVVFTRNLRTASVGKLLSLPYSFYEKQSSGDLLSRLRNDLEAVKYIYAESVFRFLLGVFYGGGSIILMMCLCWQLSVVIIILGAIETYLTAVISKKIRLNSEAIQELAGKHNQLFLDIIKSVSFIKIASLSHIMTEKYININEENVDISTQKNKVIIMLNLINELGAAVNLLAVLGIGILMYFYGLVDLGSVMSFLILQDGITYMSGNFKDFFSGINSQLVNCNRTMEILNQEGESDVFVDNERTIPYDDIDMHNVSFKYGEDGLKALDNISCKIPKGVITVIYGPSGGGKSTLTKVLLKLLPAQSGQIYIGDLEYKDLDIKTTRAFYSYVSQMPYLFYDTVEANIRCGNLTASTEEVIKAAKLAGAHDFISGRPEGYLTLVEEHGVNFSGGERQRLAISRAILKTRTLLSLTRPQTPWIWNANHLYMLIYPPLPKKVKQLL